MSSALNHNDQLSSDSKVRPLPLEHRQRQVPEEDNEAQAAIRKYLRILFQYKWSILALALIGIALGAYKAFTAVPIYRAATTVAISPDYSNAIPGQNLNMYYAASWRFYETQFEMIRSRAVAERVVEKLGLVHRKSVNQPAETTPGLIELITTTLGLDTIANAADAYMSGAAAESEPGPVRQAVLQAVQAVKKTLGLDAAAEKPRSDTEIALDMRSPEQLEKRKESLAAMIRNGVSVASNDQSQIATVRFESPDPQFAAEAANAVVDAYIELGLESRLDRTRRTSTWLTERLEDLREKVAESEDRLQEFQKKEGLVGSESMEEISSAKLKYMNDEVIRAQKMVSELSERYGPKHPKMISARAELEAAERRLDGVSQNIVQETTKQFELNKLEREVAANRQLYESFLAKFEETDLSSQYTITSAQIVDAARVPGSPVKPEKEKFVLQWGMMGLFMGLLLSLLREQLHNTFRTNEDVEQKLALAVLGVVPMLDRKGQRAAKRAKRKNRSTLEFSPERYFLANTKSAFSESINHVRTGIAYSDVDNPPRTILITSSVQGEGKTTLASNLALSCANLGRTLLIDADLRKPRLEHITPAESQGGLVEYVAGLRTLQECIVQDTENPSLYILKGGTIPPNPLELLSSQTVSRTLAQLRNKFSHIIIDTAPILPVSDAIVLGHIADAVLLVIQAEQTTTRMARDAVKRLEGAGIRTMGVVLSQVYARRSAYYYDGKYQYYYGGYYHSGDDKLA